MSSSCYCLAAYRFSWLGNQSKGAIAQINQWDNGATYNSVIEEDYSVDDYDKYVMRYKSEMEYLDHKVVE